MTHDTTPGDRCTNGPHERRWTCPACYHDHGRAVEACDGCGTALFCTIENPPLAVCMIPYPSEEVA